MLVIRSLLARKCAGRGLHAEEALSLSLARLTGPSEEKKGVTERRACGTLALRGVTRAVSEMIGLPGGVNVRAQHWIYRFNAMPGSRDAIPGFKTTIPGSTSATPGLTNPMPGFRVAMPGWTGAMASLAREALAAGTATSRFTVGSEGFSTVMPGFAIAISGLTIATRCRPVAIRTLVDATLRSTNTMPGSTIAAVGFHRRGARFTSARPALSAR